MIDSTCPTAAIRASRDGFTLALDSLVIIEGNEWPRLEKRLIVHPGIRTDAADGSRKFAGLLSAQGEIVSVSTSASHLRVDRYGDFRLTQAIRPAAGVPIVPRQGYRRELFNDKQAGLRIPVLVAAVSAEKLFDVFIDLLTPLGDTVDIVLETSHESTDGSHSDRIREEIDLPVLASYLCDFEDLVLNDGCTGLAVVGANQPMEVQFDEHKLLIVYAHDLVPFERVLRAPASRESMT